MQEALLRLYMFFQSALAVYIKSNVDVHTLRSVKFYFQSALSWSQIKRTSIFLKCVDLIPNLTYIDFFFQSD